MKTLLVSALLLLGLSAPDALLAQSEAPSNGGSAAPSDAPPAPEVSDVCCTIVSMNHRQGRGTAIDHRTGEEIPFHLKKRSLANRLKEGEVLRMDRPGHRLMLYAPEECCVATSVPNLEGISSPPEISFVDCCLVLSYDASTGTGSARVRTTGETFEFFVNQSIFTGMEPGDRLWIEPETMKVGVARDLECCAF